MSIHFKSRVHALFFYHLSQNEYTSNAINHPNIRHTPHAVNVSKTLFTMHFSLWITLLKEFEGDSDMIFPDF